MEDMHEITDHIKKEHLDTPIILLGHSIGSFLARIYIQVYSDVDGVILVGTGFTPIVTTKAGKCIAKLFSANEEPPLMNKLIFGNYNKRISFSKQ